MSWAQPEWLLALFGVPPLVLLLAITGWLHRRKLRRVLSTELFERVLPRRVRVRRTLRDVALVLASVALVLALAEPRFDKQVRTMQTRGTDIVILLDLSRSMDARDVDPSRLERARREIEDLGRQIEGDRIGLVVFAGGAYPRLPLTADFKAVQLVVGEATTDTFDTQGSNLAAAIRAGIELLDRSQEHAGQALLVLSDGETHAPPDALAAADEAVERKVPIFAMGIGDQPAPIPMPDGRFLQWKGQTVTSTPDFDTLKQVAKRTGGAFVQSSAGSRDMEQLYSEIRRSVKAVERTAQQRETYRSAFQVPLGLAVVLLLAAGWLGEGRPRLVARAAGAAALAAVALGLGLLSTPARAEDPLLEADQLYRSGKYPQAVEKLVELSLEHPDDPDVLQRLGAARYRTGDYEGAARAFDQAAQLSGEPESDFDAGNAEYQAGRLEDAKARYEKVLAADPDNAAAKQNHDLVVKELEARRAAKPPPPPQGGGSDQDKSKNNQKQQNQQQNQQQKGDKSQQGNPQGQQQGTPNQPGDPNQKQQGQQNQGTPSNDKPDGKDPSQAVSPDKTDQNGGNPQNQGGNPQTTASGDRAGPITAGQAERLLDSVDEGNQRMVFEGKTDQEPW